MLSDQRADGEIVGYIGLGALGSELARRLMAHHRLLVWDLNPAAIKRLVDEGAEAAASVADLAGRASVVFMCLPRSSDVRELLFGKLALASALRPGTLVVDQTSGSSSETHSFAHRLGHQDVALIDAAVSATPEVVPRGLATLMVSGPEAAVARALPLLKCISETIWRCGSSVGDGQSMKMLNNAMNSSCRFGTLELVAVGRGMGVSLACLTQVLNKGGAANITTERMLPAIAEGREATNFSLALMIKDLGQAVGLGMDAGVPMPATSAVLSLLEIGLQWQGPQARIEDMISVVERMANIRFRDAPVAGADGAVMGSADCGRPITLTWIGPEPPGDEVIARWIAIPGLDATWVAHAPDGSAGQSLALVAPGTGTPLDALGVAILSPSTAGQGTAQLGARLGALAGQGFSVVVDAARRLQASSEQLAASLGMAGMTVIEVGTVGARSGDPKLLAYAGPRDLCETLRPVLQGLCPEVVYCGALGRAKLVRAIAESVYALCAHVTLECIAVGVRSGLALRDMDAILTRGSGWSSASREILPALASGSTPGLGMTLGDGVQSLQEIARAAMQQGMPITLINPARAAVECAAQAESPVADFGRLVHWFESSTGASLR